MSVIDVTDLKQSLFTLQRFQILSAALTEGPKQRLADAYVYAWEELVFPSHHEAADWHKPYPNHFDVTQAMMNELVKFLDDRWLDKNVPSFYELEDHYGVRGGTTVWGRIELVRACRYLKLCGLFDDDFWGKLLTNGQCPSEAHVIAHEYQREENLFFH